MQSLIEEGLLGTIALALDAAVYAGESNTLKLLLGPPLELRGRIILVPGSNLVQMALRYLGSPFAPRAPATLQR